MTAIDFAAGPRPAGDLDVRWNHGARGEQPIQVHSYDPHTYVLRQSKATSYEAPFLYLLFGNERAILLDTGATADPAIFPLGRLYAPDHAEFARSIDRLVDFAAARPVTHVMGCNIEMTRTPGLDYPIGTKYQPDEPPLQMTVAQLDAVRDAARSASAKRGAHTFDDFIIFNGSYRAAVVRQLARTMWRRALGRDRA
jgi:hypothetical protein